MERVTFERNGRTHTWTGAAGDKRAAVAHMLARGWVVATPAGWTGAVLGLGAL